MNPEQKIINVVYESHFHIKHHVDGVGDLQKELKYLKQQIEKYFKDIKDINRKTNVTFEPRL
jgi:hypothetical protein